MSRSESFLGEHMHRFVFITIHPNLLTSVLDSALWRRASQLGKCSYEVINLRDFAVDHRGTVDDRVYGGGEGMLLRPEPLAAAIESVKDFKNAQVFMPSAAGSKWECSQARSYAVRPCTQIWICPRFSGVDQRVTDCFDIREVSLGDFIVSGGELPSLLMVDSILRFVPGVLGDTSSAERDSFSPEYDGMLEQPQYTRPEEFRGLRVPDVLLSGNHAAIDSWQQQQRQVRTSKLRPDKVRKS